MIRKLRRKYYRYRDVGKGKKFITIAVLIGVSVFALSGFLVYGIIRPFLPSEKIATEEIAGIETESVEELDIDVTDLESFLSFMEDKAYEELIQETKELCMEKGCDRVIKFEYQDVGETEYDIVTYLKFSDGSILSCNYNLTSGEYQLEETTLTENELEEKWKVAQEEEGMTEAEPTSTPEPKAEPTPTVTPKVTPLPTVAPQVTSTVPPETTSTSEPTKKPTITSKPKKKKSSKKKKAKAKKKTVKKSSSSSAISNTRKGSGSNDTAVTSDTATIQ